MKVANGHVQMKPGERAVVVQDAGFPWGIPNVMVCRHKRNRVYGKPTAASIERVRRLFLDSGDFARVGMGDTGIGGWWVHPGMSLWKVEKGKETPWDTT